MAEFDASDRRLFENAAMPLYEEIATSGGLPLNDPRLNGEGELKPAMGLLLALNLVVGDQTTKRYTAVDPSTAASQVVTPLSQQGALLLNESSEWARAFGGLAQAWRRSPAAVTGPITEFRLEAIGPFIKSAVADATEELLTAQPQAGRDSKGLAVVAASEKEMLDRGVKVRTLYQHSARRNAVTRKYVSEVSAYGREVRTLDEFFNRMIVIDRRLAIIPSVEDLTVAMAIREQGLVAYLVDIFERAWERARPFSNTERSMMADIAAEQRDMTIRMLIEGHSDPVSAKRLGVSPRTFAGYVADLKEEYDAETRFQLGYVMGQAGVSGNPSNNSG